MLLSLLIAECQLCQELWYLWVICYVLRWCGLSYIHVYSYFCYLFTFVHCMGGTFRKSKIILKSIQNVWALIFPHSHMYVSHGILLRWKSPAIQCFMHPSLLGKHLIHRVWYLRLDSLLCCTYPMFLRSQTSILLPAVPTTNLSPQTDRVYTWNTLFINHINVWYQITLILIFHISAYQHDVHLHLWRHLCGYVCFIQLKLLKL